MQIWTQLTFFDLVISIFLVIIATAFGFLLFRSDTLERAYQKIIGGFAVFIVALISRNPYVIAVSLFIGGLIIASEHFMKSLAAILRADSPDIPSILYGKATEEDVKKKEEEEVKTIESIRSTNKSENNEEEDIRLRLARRRQIEALVADALEQKFKGSFFKNVKLFEGSLIVDGVIADTAGKAPYRFVEIKYFRHHSPALMDYSVNNIIGRIRGVQPDAEIIFVAVADNLSPEQAEKIELPILKKYKKVSVLTYSYNASTKSVKEIDWF